MTDSGRVGVAGAAGVGVEKPRRRRGTIVAVLAVFLGVAVLDGVRRDGLSRQSVERFIAESGLAARRPLDAASLSFEPEADLAGTAAVLSAIVETAAPEPADPNRGAARKTVPSWLPSARRLTLAALEARPGWPLHAHAMAEVAYREWRSPGAPPDPRRWMSSWRTATRGAPAVAHFRSRWAEACLESWQALPQDLRVNGLGAIRAAFVDPDFVARGMSAAAGFLGVNEAIALLPARSEPIRAAAAVIAQRDLDAAKRLLDRADSLERAERSAALRRIEGLVRARREGEAREACRAFAAEYPPERFDDPAGRSETSRLLELWPRDPGSWETDARAPLVRFLVDRSEPRAAEAAILRRAVDPLSGVPLPVAAALLDSSDDRATAEKLRNSTAASSAGDWFAYDVGSARRALARGDVPAARRAIDRLPPAFRDDCEVLLVRRQIASRAGDATGSAEIDRRLTERQSDSAVRDRWRSTGRLVMCIDPAGARRSLAVTLEASSPAIVAYGWDGRRAGTWLISGPSAAAVSLDGVSGAREFWITGLAGGAVTPTEARFAPIENH